MEKTGIDPRLVTTPIGAALGLVLTKKIIDKKDQNLLNLGAGTALGGAGGYFTGEALRSGQLEGASTIPGQASRDLSATEVTPAQIKALREDPSITTSVKSYGGDDPSRLQRITNQYTRNRFERARPALEASSILKLKLAGLIRSYKNPNLSASAKESLKQAILEHGRRLNETQPSWGSRLSWGWDLVKAMVNPDTPESRLQSIINSK